MLEHIPRKIGEALKDIRPGFEKLVCTNTGLSDLPDTLELGMPALDGTVLPPRFTADGAGISPALTWSGVPEGTAELVLIVEDADAPSPKPLVHLIAYAIPPEDAGVPEGAFSKPTTLAVGKNSYLSSSWLAPDPPTGHGPHRYVFQLFALDSLSMLSGSPGRRDVIATLEDKATARGLLLATYERA